VRSECPPVAQVVEVADEHQPARRVGVGEPGREERRNRRDSTRTGKRKPGLHGTQRVPPGFPRGRLERYPAARHDHVDMRMVRHRRTPAVEDGGGLRVIAMLGDAGGTSTNANAPAIMMRRRARRSQKAQRSEESRLSEDGRELGQDSFRNSVSIRRRPW
jgi:hypothetical protein